MNSGGRTEETVIWPRLEWLTNSTKETDMRFPDSTVTTEDDTLAESMKAWIQNQINLSLASNDQTLRTIHRVPPSVRNKYKEDYDPKIISIGPFHRKEERLKPMEELKWRYLEDTLNCSNDNGLLAKYISVIRQLEGQARMKYGEALDEIDSNSFIQMMVLDGCFIIQLLTKYYIKHESLHKLRAENWNLPCLRSDLLLLENQIPFFVVQALFNLSSFLHVPGIPLANLAAIFLRTSVTHTPIHLLDIFHESFYEGHDGCLVKLSGSILNQPRAPRMIPNVTKLIESGVKFKKRDVQNLMLVLFKDGVLEIPTIAIQEETPSLFRNLIAFEQCCSQSGSNFTSYATLMNNLIDTPRDVAILKRCGIIESKLGKDEDVAELFNELCRGAYLDYEHHNLKYLFEQLKEYSEVYLHRCRAKLMHDYFGNPWAIISFAAAIFLIILTTVQAFYAVYAYHRPPN